MEEVKVQTVQTQEVQHTNQTTNDYWFKSPGHNNQMGEIPGRDCDISGIKSYYSLVFDKGGNDCDLMC